MWFQRLYVLFFIEIASRRVHLAGCTSQPNGEWVTQQARQVAWTVAGIAERFVRTVRSECLDWLLIVNRRRLERTLTVFVDHYNGYRPHRSLDLAPPNGRPAIENWAGTRPMAVKRRDHLGGLLHEYERAA